METNIQLKTKYNDSNMYIKNIKTNEIREINVQDSVVRNPSWFKNVKIKR